MEFLISFGCLCALATVVVAVGVLVVAMTVRRGQRVGAQRDAQQDLIAELGLVPVAGSAWHEGEVDGLRIAAKASQGANVGMLGSQFDGRRMFVTVIAMAPVAMEPIGGRLDIAAHHRADTVFETMFVPTGEATHGDVPEAMRRALMAWVHETDDDVVLVDRDSRWSYAGPALQGEAVVVRVEHTGPLDAEAVAAWLSAVVRRARSLTPPG